MLFALRVGATSQSSDLPSQPYTPPELQVSDPDVKTLVDSAKKSANLGNYEESLASLRKASEIATKHKATADKAIIEDLLAVYYFTRGRVDEARSHFLEALSGGIAVGNIALQADVLVALSALQQVGGHLDQAMKSIDQALDLSRKSKNLYIQSRVLGELSRLQQLAGKLAEAQASIDEALQIDRLNRYDWEPGHLLYLANLNVAQSKADKALEIGTSARDLAIKNDNYLVFIQSSLFLGNGYVRTGHPDEGIRMIELSRKGISEQNKPLFHSPDGYNRTASLPYLEVSILEGLASAYEAAKRPDEALKNWEDLYEIATASGFAIARAESATKVADLYKAKNDFTRAIDFYARAAEASAIAENESSRIAALTAEEVLLFQLGEKEKALNVEEELLSSAKASKNLQAQLICDLIIAEILDGSGRLDRVERALEEADSLVGYDGSLSGVQPELLVELYFRLANVYDTRKDIRHDLMSLEKAVTPALGLSSAPGDNKKNREPLAWLVPQIEQKIAQSHIREIAEKSFADGNFADALVCFELLRYFEELEAAWTNKYQEYIKHLDNDSTNAKLLQIPPRLISQDNGPAFLAKNLAEMGPIAGGIRPLSLGLLTSYYMSHQRPDMVVRFAREATSSIRFGENDTPTPFAVAMICELATGLTLEKDVESALEILPQCMTGAEKLGIPQLLQAAHQARIGVLEAAGKHSEADESIRFLLKETPDDPLQYAVLAQIREQEGENIEAQEAWRKSIPLYESRKNLNGAADAHLALANLLSLGPAANPEERRVHLEAADELYRQLGSVVGQVNVKAALGSYYASRKNPGKSRQYFENARSLAQNIRRNDLEAYVASQEAQADEVSGNLQQAVAHYSKAADLYQQQKDPASEAFQLKNLATILNNLGRPDEALQIAVRAKAAADSTTSWSARYWVRRTLAGLYGNRGQYQDGVNVLREAKKISADANQPLSTAWAEMDLAAGLETIGDWEDASEQINSAVPTLKHFKDTDDEATAYIELMAIYGARESDLKDIPKALQFYQMAYDLTAKTHPERAASLDLDLTEIYWDQGRFKDAITKASEALEYYKKTGNDLGEASALISLAEAQRSDDDLSAAANSLRMAEPLVHRLNNFYTLGRFYYGLAGLYRAQGRISDAIEQYERVVQMLEQFKSSSNAENQKHVAEHYDFIYDELVESYYSLAQSDERQVVTAANKALEYAELNKARAFSNSWGYAFVDSLRQRVPAALQDSASKRVVLQSELQEAMAVPGKRPVKQVEEKLAKLGIAESELAEQLRRTSPAYAEVRYPQRMGIQQIPLHAGELLVQLKVLPHRTVVWLFPGTEQGATLDSFYEVNRPSQWFADRIFRIRDAFNGGHPEQFDSRVTDELLGALFPDSALRRIKAAKAIIFVPDGVLFLLPFEMLSSHGQYPLLDKPTEYFPSSAALRLARTSTHASGAWPESFIGIADPITSPDDPRYQATALASEVGAPTGPGQSRSSTSLDRVASRGFSLERLPGTADEVNGIAGLFTSTQTRAEVRTGMDATKQDLLRTDLARYRFVHFATHGILPVESGIKEPSLVLSYDGIGTHSARLRQSAFRS